MRGTLLSAGAVFCLSFNALVQPLRAAEPAKAVRFSIEFSTYRGYWRIEDSGGKEVAHDECFTQRLCREVIKALGPGDYALVLSQQPQSMPLKFRLTPNDVAVTSGKDILSATKMTLKLGMLRRVLFNLDGYRGAWSLANWDGAEATGFFRRDGGEQAVELAPNTTYAFKLGPVIVERFQVDANERVILIDGNGALKVSPDARNKFVLATLPVAIYPETNPDTSQWTVAGVGPLDGRPGYKGPEVLRLAQGATYRLNLAGAAAQDKPVEFLTGKGCSMPAQTLKIAATIIFVAPVLAGCQN